MTIIQKNVRAWSTDGLDKSKGYASNDEKVKSHTAKNRDYLPLTNSSQRGYAKYYKNDSAQTELP